MDLVLLKKKGEQEAAKQALIYFKVIKGDDCESDSDSDCEPYEEIYDKKILV